MIVNIVSPHASHYLGGMEIVTLQIAKHLAELGVEVRFFTRKVDCPSDVYQRLKERSSTLLKIIEIPLAPNTSYPDGTWPRFYHLSCTFGAAATPYYERYRDADLFITHLSVDSHFIPQKSRTLLHLHGNPEQVDPLMEAAVGIPSTTLAHSESIKHYWKLHFPDLNPILFQNGIDTDSFTGDPDGDRPIDILYVGRFLEHKGILDILNAVRSTQRIIIAGNGAALIPRIHQIINSRSLEDAVTIIDTPSTETIQQLYRQAKIFACPSRGREGVLTTMLEAGASGCAIVTTSGSGMTDFAQNNSNAVVLPPGDIIGLQDAFDMLLANPVKRISLASAAQSEIRQNWTWRHKASQLKDIYQHAL